MILNKIMYFLKFCLANILKPIWFPEIFIGQPPCFRRTTLQIIEIANIKLMVNLASWLTSPKFNLFWYGKLLLKLKSPFGEGLFEEFLETLLYYEKRSY